MMLEFANFVGQDARHFAGTIIFILACCYGLSWVIGSFRGGPPDV